MEDNMNPLYSYFTKKRLNKHNIDDLEKALKFINSKSILSNEEKGIKIELENIIREKKTKIMMSEVKTNRSPIKESNMKTFNDIINTTGYKHYYDMPIEALQRVKRELEMLKGKDSRVDSQLRSVYNELEKRKVKELKPNKDYGNLVMNVKDWNKENISKRTTSELLDAKKTLDGYNKGNGPMEQWQKVGYLVNMELDSRKKNGEKVKRLSPNKDYGKYKSPIKENDMKTINRLERLIMREEESMGASSKIETPLQSTGSTPEPKSIGSSSPAPMKPEPSMNPEEQKPESNQSHTQFMDMLKPTMEKVKANQIVTWEELKKLADSYEKIRIA